MTSDAPTHLRSLLAVASVVLATAAAAQQQGEHEGHEADGHGQHARSEHGKHDGHAHGEHGDLHSPGHHHDFSDVERWSRIFDAPERDAWQRPAEVIELLELEPGMSVADLGAGTGYFLPYLAAAVGAEGKVYGLDVEESLVEHMRQRAAGAGLEQVEARRVPMDAPGLSDGSIDRLLIVNTWHHLDDRPSYTRKIDRALRDRGFVVIVDYTLESESGPPKQHRLAPERVIAELAAGGLEGEVVAEDLPRQYVIVARRP